MVLPGEKNRTVVAIDVPSDYETNVDDYDVDFVNTGPDEWVHIRGRSYRPSIHRGIPWTWLEPVRVVADILPHPANPGDIVVDGPKFKGTSEDDPNNPGFPAGMGLDNPKTPKKEGDPGRVLTPKWAEEHGLIRPIPAKPAH